MQHVAPHSFALRLAIVRFRNGNGYRLRRWKSSNISQAISDGFRGGQKTPTIAPYVSRVGHHHGIYYPRSDDSKSKYDTQKNLYSIQTNVWRYHTWRMTQIESLGCPCLPTREFYLMKHLGARDVPLWVETGAWKKNLTGIIRSKAMKRLTNVTREVLARRGFGMDGWPISHSATDKEEGKGPVLWGSLQLATFSPIEIAATSFQHVLARMDEKFGDWIVDSLKIPIAKFRPEEYPQPGKRSYWSLAAAPSESGGGKKGQRPNKNGKLDKLPKKLDRSSQIKPQNQMLS